MCGLSPCVLSSVTPMAAQSCDVAELGPLAESTFQMICLVDLAHGAFPQIDDLLLRPWRIQKKVCDVRVLARLLRIEFPYTHPSPV